MARQHDTMADEPHDGSMSETESWTFAIVGGGAAGLSAALVLGRARRRVLVIDAGGQSNLPAHGIGGLLGHDGTPPAELYARGRAELAAYPTVEVRDDRVVGGERTASGFALRLAGGARIDADRVILATGMTYALPDLPGLAPLWGRTAFHCPYCHGWEARDGRLAVLGGFAGAHRALLLRGWSDDVALLTDGPADLDPGDREALERAGVAVDERPVSGLRGTGDVLEAVRFADGEELERDGLLVHAPLEQRGPLAAELGATFAERGGVDVDGFGRTVVPGLYAVGDVSTPMPQVAAAIAEGSATAAAANMDVVAAEHGRPPMLPPREVPAIATG
jgi:thioredoxin reductase